MAERPNGLVLMVLDKDHFLYAIDIRFNKVSCLTQLDMEGQTTSPD